MEVDLLLSAGEKGLFFQIKKGLLRYKKDVKWEDIRLKKGEKTGKVKAADPGIKKKNAIAQLREILQLFSVSTVTVQESCGIPGNIYFFFYAFMFPFLGNVFVVKNSEMNDYFRIESAVDLKIIKGGKYLWKRLLKSWKS